jgi:hypothetical protein
LGSGFVTRPGKNTGLTGGGAEGQGNTVHKPFTFNFEVEFD